MAEPALALVPPLGDGELVLSAREGSDLAKQAAKEALFRRHVGMISGLVFRLLGSDVELEDLVQETFVRAFEKLHRLEQPDSFGGWIATIATGVTISAIRRRRVLRRLGLLRAEPIAVEQFVARTAPPDVASELARVYRAVEQLPTRERVVLVLRRVDGCALEEIVERTGWSLATVKRILARADRELEKLGGAS